jgi:hypothetical protein
LGILQVVIDMVELQHLVLSIVQNGLQQTQAGYAAASSGSTSYIAELLLSATEQHVEQVSRHFCRCWFLIIALACPEWQECHARAAYVSCPRTLQVLGAVRGAWSANAVQHRLYERCS